MDCLEELQRDDPLKVNTSLLLGTAAFERALGDVSNFTCGRVRSVWGAPHYAPSMQVYLTVSKATQCPPLLRDLLATMELEDTLGKCVVS